MKSLTFITTNQSKAHYLATWLGLPVAHRSIDLPELQSLDLRTVVEHKTQAAFAAVGTPVLVEDVSFVMHALGKLPGPFIRWFLTEIGPDRLCQIAQAAGDLSATAMTMYGLFDGTSYHTFAGVTEGTVSATPRNFVEGNGWKTPISWNRIFIPRGSAKAYAEMTDDELEPFSHRAKAIQKLREHLVRDQYGQ